MFPALKSTVSGLEPAAKYYILLDLCLADDSRYKWTGAEWQVAGKAEPQMPSRFFIHPDSPATGAQWMKHDISFQKVKLTNNNMDPNGHVSQSSPSVRQSLHFRQFPECELCISPLTYLRGATHSHLPLSLSVLPPRYRMK